MCIHSSLKVQLTEFKTSKRRQLQVIRQLWFYMQLSAQNVAKQQVAEATEMTRYALTKIYFRKCAQSNPHQLNAMPCGEPYNDQMGVRPVAQAYVSE